jgi:hypothetical protein
MVPSGDKNGGGGKREDEDDDGRKGMADRVSKEDVTEDGRR